MRIKKRAPFCRLINWCTENWRDLQELHGKLVERGGWWEGSPSGFLNRVWGLAEESDLDVRNQSSFKLSFICQRGQGKHVFLHHKKNNSVRVVINVVQLTLGSGRDCGKLEGLCSFQRKHLFLSPTVLFSCGNGAQRVQNYNSLKEVRQPGFCAESLNF